MQGIPVGVQEASDGIGTRQTRCQKHGGALQPRDVEDATLAQAIASDATG